LLVFGRIPIIDSIVIIGNHISTRCCVTRENKIYCDHSWTKNGYPTKTNKYPLLCYRVTAEKTNLFNSDNYAYLEKWRNEFRFCTCAEGSPLYLNNEFTCNGENTDIQDTCTEYHDEDEDDSLRDDVCALLKRKRSVDSFSDTHSSDITRKSLIAVKKVNHRALYTLWICCCFKYFLEVFVDRYLRSR